MANNTCELTLAHPVTGVTDQESILNKKLNKLYPSEVSNDSKMAGVNNFYLHMRQDPKFLEWFGDWTNPDTYKELLDKATNTNVFNEQGEPSLQMDNSGAYILNVKGEWKYVKPLFDTVNAGEMSKIVNTLTGDYIKTQNQSMMRFINDTLDTRVTQTNDYLKRLRESLSTIKDPTLSITVFDQISKAGRKLNKLKDLQVSPEQKNHLKKMIVERLESYNFKYKEDVDDKQDNPDYNEINNFTMDSNETSNRAINDPKILSFLSSVPKFTTYHPDSDKQLTESNLIIGSNIYTDQGAIWGLLEGIFTDILPDQDTTDTQNKDIFENFLLAAQNVATINEHSELNYVTSYLTNLAEQPGIKAEVEVTNDDGETVMEVDEITTEKNVQEFKTKMVAAFFKSTQNYIITQVTTQRNDISGEYQTVFKVIDPAVKNSKVGKLTNEYIETALVSSAMKDDTPGETLANFKAAKDRLMKSYDSIRRKKNYDDYYAFLDDVLNNTLGLEITKPILDTYITTMTQNGSDYSGLRAEIKKLLHNPVRDEQLNLDSPVIGEFELFHTLVKSKTTRKVATVFKERLMSKNSFLRGVANAAKLFNMDVSESSFIVGGSQRWAYSYTSGLNIEVGNWKKGDISSLKRLKTKGYMLADAIIEDPRLLDEMDIYTNSEIKKENDSNPVLHKKITEVDYHLDNLVKMFNSSDEHYQNTELRKQGEGSTRAKEQVKLKNYITYNFGADKNSLFSIFGLPDVTDGKDIYSYKTRMIKPPLKKILNKYVAGELQQAQEAGELIEEYFNQEDADKRNFAMTRLIPGYHYNTDKDIETESLAYEDFKNGNYHKLGIFTSSLNKYLAEDDGYNADLIYRNNNKYPIVRGTFAEINPITKSNSQLDKLMAHVYADVNEVIKQNYDYLNDIILVRKEDESTGEVTEVRLPEVKTNIKIGNSEQALYKYVIASFLNSYELSNIFNGHAAFYAQKNPNDIELTDFLKRAPAITTDGKYLRHRNKRDIDGKGLSQEEAQARYGKTYTDYDDNTHEIYDKDDHIVVAIANNIDIKRSVHADLIAKATGQNLSFEHEMADAQGYVTADHFRDIIERIYGFNAYDEKMYSELTDPSHKVTDENIRWIKTASKSFTPLKMVHFEVTNKWHSDAVPEETATGVPIYLKYSLAPLFPAMTSGTEMETISNQMKKQGVEQLVFKSGSKASNPTPTTIHNTNEDNNYAGVKEDLKFNPFVIDSNKIKMQVELPTKLDKDTKIGMQSPKNIMNNMNMESKELDYEFRDNRYTAAQIYNKINDTAVSMLQNQLNGLLNELGYLNKPITDDTGKPVLDKQGNPKTVTEFNTKNIKRLLIKQMDIETERDLIHLLQTDLPFETVPNFAQRAFPVISSYLTKKAGKIYTNGSSVVQVANVGYDRLTKKQADGIFFLSDQKELTPPLPETNAAGEIVYYDPETGGVSTKEKGGKMRVKKAKIMLPFSSVFAKTGLSYDEFKALYKQGDSRVSRAIFQNILGYRIPNQAISSNDSFEIVGILPPIAGDQAIVYHEITAKTGSDFDIDKMYLAMPNFKVNKEYYLPEDNKKMYEFLKDRKADALHLEYYMNRYKFKNGMQLAEMFMQNERAKELIESNAAFKLGKPVKAILNVAEDLMDVLDTDGTHINVGNTSYELLDILDDLLAAHNRQVTDIKETYQKFSDEAWDYKKENSLRRTTSLEYIKDTSTQRGLQNEFIELLNSVLESPASYNDLMSPLDSTDIKDSIHKIAYLKSLDVTAREEFNKQSAKKQNEVIKAFTESNKETGLQQMFPVSLLKSRVDVLEAKTLISIMANNMTDLGESQKVGFAMEYPLGLKEGDTQTQSLAREYMLNHDKNDDMKLSKIVSYLMNASVDAAKDSYIISGNFTTYTANAAMMMVRLGVNPDQLFTILMNDEIMKLSRAKNFQKAKTSDITSEHSQDQLDEWSSIVLSKIANHDNDIFKVISEDDFLSNNPDKKQDILGYWNLLVTMGKEFNDAVIAMKSDSNSAGKNIPEFIVIKNRLEKMMRGATLNSEKKWFKNGLTPENRQFNPDIKSDPDAKMLGALANNTLFLMEELSKNMFIETTENVQETMAAMLNGLGQPLSTDESMIKLMYSYLYPYLLFESGHKIYDINPERKEFLLEEFPKKLQAYKDMKNRDINGTGNPFLNQLQISTSGDVNLIKFPTFKNFSTQNKQMFKDALTDMMNDVNPSQGDPKSKRKFYGLMGDLVQYAFLTTGFKSTYFSYNEYLPANYFLNTMHGRNIQKYIDKLNNAHTNPINPDKALTLIAKDHSQNYKVVKKMSRKTAWIYTQEGHIIPKKTDTKDTHDKLRIDKDAYVPFFTKSNILYMMVGRDANNSPVYESIDKNDAREFNSYTFYKEDIEGGLTVDNVRYESPTRKLHENVASLTEEDIFDNNDKCDTK